MHLHSFLICTGQNPAFLLHREHIILHTLSFGFGVPKKYVFDFMLCKSTPGGSEHEVKNAKNAKTIVSKLGFVDGLGKVSEIKYRSSHFYLVSSSIT